VNLACRNDQNSPILPGASITFYVHESVAGVLLETLLGDVSDENISFVFGTKTGMAWQVTGDGIPEAVRQYAQYLRDGRQSFVCADEVSHWVEDTFAQEIPTVEFADGTNVIGTDYVYSSARTTTWYVPRDSKPAKNWKSHFERIREHFEGMAFVNRPIECTMVQTRVPGYHLNPLPATIYSSDNTIGGGSGLSRDCSQLFTRDGIPIFSEYPFRDAAGQPICNSVGDAFGWRLGLSRMYFNCSPNWVGDYREIPGPSFEELANECASLLFRMPVPVAVSLWKNWPEGFDRKSNSSQYLWFDAVFELAWQGQPGDRLYAERFAPTSTGSIVLSGNGLFPRIPKQLLNLMLGRVAHEYGNPVVIVSKMKNFVLASIAAIDELLEHG
jgi:hypothetical protein